MLLDEQRQTNEERTMPAQIGKLSTFEIGQKHKRPDRWNKNLASRRVKLHFD
jgi:hypothetical protein